MLPGWPHAEVMFSLALLSAVMVCITVPGNVQKPEGTAWNKKVIGSDRWKKTKSLYRPEQASHWEYV